MSKLICYSARLIFFFEDASCYSFSEINLKCRKKKTQKKKKKKKQQQTFRRLWNTLLCATTSNLIILFILISFFLPFFLFSSFLLSFISVGLGYLYMLVHKDSMTISTLTELYHMIRGLLCSAPRHQTLPYFSYLFPSSFHSSFFLHSFLLSFLLVWGICICWYIMILWLYLH